MLGKEQHIRHVAGIKVFLMRSGGGVAMAAKVESRPAEKPQHHYILVGLRPYERRNFKIILIIGKIFLSRIMGPAPALAHGFALEQIRGTIALFVIPAFHFRTTRGAGQTRFYLFRSVQGSLDQVALLHGARGLTAARLCNDGIRARLAGNWSQWPPEPAQAARLADDSMPVAMT